MCTHTDARVHVQPGGEDMCVTAFTGTARDRQDAKWGHKFPYDGIRDGVDALAGPPFYATMDTGGPMGTALQSLEVRPNGNSPGPVDVVDENVPGRLLPNTTFTLWGYKFTQLGCFAPLESDRKWFMFRFNNPSKRAHSLGYAAKMTLDAGKNYMGVTRGNRDSTVADVYIFQNESQARSLLGGAVATDSCTVSGTGSETAVNLYRVDRWKWTPPGTTQPVVVPPTAAEVAQAQAQAAQERAYAAQQQAVAKQRAQQAAQAANAQAMAAQAAAANAYRPTAIAKPKAAAVRR